MRLAIYPEGRCVRGHAVEHAQGPLSASTASTSSSLMVRRSSERHYEQSLISSRNSTYSCTARSSRRCIKQRYRSEDRCCYLHGQLGYFGCLTRAKAASMFLSEPGYNTEVQGTASSHVSLLIDRSVVTLCCLHIRYLDLLYICLTIRRARVRTYTQGQ